MLPKSFFNIQNIQAVKTNLGECCVLMPFANEFKKVYEAIKSAIEGGEVCFNCVRADEFLHGGSVMEDILSAIGRAEIIVADLTKMNPNVFYEIGIAHTVKDPEKVIMISQDSLANDIPFDVRSLRIKQYNSSHSGLMELKKWLTQVFIDIGEHSWQFEVSDGEDYKKDMKVFGLDSHNYMFGLSKVEVGNGGVTFGLIAQRTDDNRIIEPKRLSLKVQNELEIPGLGWKLKLLKANGHTSKFGIGRHKSE